MDFYGITAVILQSIYTFSTDSLCEVAAQLAREDAGAKEGGGN